MSVKVLLSTLQKAGCRLRVDGEALRVSATKNALTDELRQAIRENKKGEIWITLSTF